MQASQMHRPVRDRAIHHRRVTIDGINLFYREAGAPDAPVLVLLHGFPSSSVMYAGLMAQLAEHYRLIAPDYPGFGHSDAPDPETFVYTFDRLAHFTQRFLDALDIERYALYLQDYGGPIGMRIALAHPERVSALIVQNAVMHEEGLSGAWALRRRFWQERQCDKRCCHRRGPASGTWPVWPIRRASIPKRGRASMRF